MAVFRHFLVDEPKPCRKRSLISAILVTVNIGGLPMAVIIALLISPIGAVFLACFRVDDFVCG